MGSTKTTYSKLTTDDGAFITVFVPGQPAPLAAPHDHPNFAAIDKLVRKIEKAYNKGNHVKADDLTQRLVDLFDVSAAVQRKFESISDSGRVTVRSGKVYFDGDEISGTLVDHIVQAMEQGADFTALVNFYERLATNPLGDVRETLYRFIEGNEGLTITPEGMVIGYKSVKRHEREDGTVVYRPSQVGKGGVVNGVPTAEGEYIEQQPGDVVEMARSIVLHAPSQACGDGLHVGTEKYARTFYGGDTVMEVEFDPRDVVSVPDSNSSWKVRVCRYKVRQISEGKRQEAVLGTPSRPEDDDERCEDCGYLYEECECEGFCGDDCEVCNPPEDDGRYDGCLDPEGSGEEPETMLDGDTKPSLDQIRLTATDLGLDLGNAEDILDDLREAAEDALEVARDALGRWVSGRPSQRDPKTGRFVG